MDTRNYQEPAETMLVELNTVICADSLEVLRSMPDNSVDLLLTDPPYGINHPRLLKTGTIDSGTPFGGKKAVNLRKTPVKTYPRVEWDRKIPSQEHFAEMMRVSKQQIIFGGNYMTEYLPPSSCWIIWDKDNGKNDFADAEMAWTSFDRATRLFKWRWNGMLQEQMKWKEKRYHPTQKPVALFRWILERFSSQGDIVLDPFLGSGTTAVACKQLGRRYIGIERESHYCDVARKRLTQSNLLEVMK